MKLFNSKRRVVLAAGIILLGLFLVRPGVSRLKTRIANSLSRAVARPVEIGAVHLRFLPQPGFDLENLVIYEDPAFGAEPMLRAPEVTAVVRLFSLARGRLDIARLELTDPSLNLVRRADGHWNLEDLLQRTARTPLAPTAKSKSEARPGFPYIEASSGRINFKAGQEKKSYALLNADFALWQESENAWGARLRAEPLRTDMNLSDTGLLRMNGTWKRASNLRETPLQFSIEWDRGQLGQLSKLISGNDKGWRGAVLLDATLSGTPAAMQVAADASIQNFHRYDIPSSGGLRLAAHCDGKYSTVGAVMHGILCQAPVGDGMITLHGDAGLPGVHQLDLGLSVESVPVSSLTELARRVKKNLPEDLISTGSVQGSFAVKEDGYSPKGAQFEGRGEITNLLIHSRNGKAEFAESTIPFDLSEGRINVHDYAKGKSVRKSEGVELQAPDEMRVEFGPFPVALGRPAPAQVRAWIARSGYGIALRGDGEVSRTLRLANLLGLPAVKTDAEGAARMDLKVAGTWSARTGSAGAFSAGTFSAGTSSVGIGSAIVSETSSEFFLPQVTGTVQLHNVHANVRGARGALEISSAELQLLPDEVRVEKLSARAADADWTGTISMPRGCGTPGACLVRFDLSAKEIGLSDVSAWLNAHPSERPWYQRLTSVESPAPTFFQSLRAAGKVEVDRVRIATLVAENVSAALDLDHGALKISDLQAEVMGGQHRGEWQADFSADLPVFTGTGTLTGISLEQVADAMQDPWISGTADGIYQLKASGVDSGAFWQSADGSIQFEVRDGLLPHIALASDDEPLRIERWLGRSHLHDGKIEIEKGKLISPAGVYEINGNASLQRALDFKLVQGPEKKTALVYSITGTVAEPHVALSSAETQAQLKP